jgi:hypothetical protein
MSGAWAVVLVFAAALAAVFWGMWAWAVLLLWQRRRRGVEPTRLEVEARDWPAAIALFLSGVALLAWLMG